jgi:hypothetical protein
MPQARNNRRALSKSLSKEAIPKIGNQEPPDLQARVEELERRILLLGEALNQNTDVFAGGYESIDKRLYTVMRVLKEMYFSPGKIHLKTEREVIKELDEVTGKMTSFIHGGRTIDWMAYFGEFHAMLGLVALVETHCQGKAEELPDNVVVFGDTDK